MIDGDISDSLFCLGLAVAKDLPDIEYEHRHPKAGVKFEDIPSERRTRRPDSYDCSVYSFPQGWSSTALGFGGIGGQAMTTAQTTVVICESHSAAIYFGRRFAYRAPVTQALMADISGHNMVEVSKAGKYRP